MISVSAGSLSPCFRALGNSTVLLCAVRTRRSRSARRPSSEARSSRKSLSSRAAFSAAVWRAMTSQSDASSATNQNAIQCRPLSANGFEHAELRRPGARVVADFLRLRNDGFLGQHAAQGAPPAVAYGLARGANTIAAPLAERV